MGIISLIKPIKRSGSEVISSSETAGSHTYGADHWSHEQRPLVYSADTQKAAFKIPVNADWTWHQEQQFSPQPDVTHLPPGSPNRQPMWAKCLACMIDPPTILSGEVTLGFVLLMEFDP